MNNLPPQHDLPINLLAGSFKHTSATYKFYWFLALLEELEKGNTIIQKLDLFAGMVANAWYTVNYFHVSFGPQDQLQRAIEKVILLENLAIDEKKSTVAHVLKNSNHSETIKTLKYFDSEVPYRFLSPWFPGLKGNKKRIYTLSQTFTNHCIYAVNETEVCINPKWLPYLLKHSGILKSFCYWHLSLYLQKHNPNVPDIPNKLIKPAQRNSLIKQRKEFWDLVIHINGPQKCIYTQNPLGIKDYAVEHFIPYAFVSHDLIWNLIPADKSFNSTKSDKIPPIEVYFEPYFQLQKLGIQTIANYHPRNRFLEDYLSFIPNINELQQLSEGTLRERFKETIQPLVTLAINNGFESLS